MLTFYLIHLCAVSFSFLFFLFFFLALEILALRPGRESLLPAGEAQSSNHWTARKFPGFNFSLDVLL